MGRRQGIIMSKNVSDEYRSGHVFCKSYKGISRPVSLTILNYIALVKLVIICITFLTYQIASPHGVEYEVTCNLY
jgi:hypothetical protein